MSDAPRTIDLQWIKALSPVIEEHCIGDDFIIGEVSGKRMEQSETILRTLQYPVRFDGFIIFYLKKGHFTVDVNLKTYEVRERSLMILVPGNIIKVSHYNEASIGETQLIFILISKEFMSGIRFSRTAYVSWTTPASPWTTSRRPLRTTTSTWPGRSSEHRFPTSAKSSDPSSPPSPTCPRTYGPGKWTRPGRTPQPSTTPV